jgi:type 1 glutamine amidotransferase
VIDRLGRESGAFETTHLPDLPSLSGLTAETLAAHQAVFFLNTSGELPLDDRQRQALLRFVSAGGGFLGAHAATDTLYAWPEYGELVGAYFREHPWTQPVAVAVVDESHPLTSGLGPAFELTEEVYTFRAAPRAPARVLLRLDPASVGASGEYPLAWCAPYGAGRSFYTALGHFDAVWQDARVQRHLLAAIRWATGQLPIEPALTRSA